jgi:fructokinase
MASITVVGEVVVDRVITGDAHVDVAGGSAANVALALAKAGDRVDFRARYSTDDLGQYLQASAQGQGIDLSNSVTAQEPATLVEIELDYAGVPHYRFSLDGTADWQWTATEIGKPLPQHTQAIIVGSLVSVIEPAASVLFDWAKSLRTNDIVLCFDPNARPTALDALGFAGSARNRIARWIEIANIIKVSEEDLEWIHPQVAPNEVAAQWSTLGPELVVLTQGGDGVIAFRDGEQICSLPGVVVDVIDTVGAGDTFLAWLVHGYLQLSGHERTETSALSHVLEIANRAAALTCTKRGCNPPTAVQMTYEQI